jgi:hypothetical protein
MNENLSQLVKETPGVDPVVFSEEELDLPIDADETEALSADGQTDSYIIQISSLTDWFDANVENFPNIRKPTVSIQGVDPLEQLIVTVQVIDEETTEQEDKRKLVVFDDSHLVPVLDLPAMDMQVYNNGFRIIYDFGEGIFIKSYGIRTGLISVFCNDINDKLIPYTIIKTKKSDTEIEIPRKDVNEVSQKLIQPLDLEALQLRYKQSSKAEDLTTNQQAVDWLIERQSSIADINHHLQIDNVIIETLA